MPVAIIPQTFPLPHPGIMTTMTSLAADPIFGVLVPSQEIQDMVLSYQLEMWHFAVAFVV